MISMKLRAKENQQAWPRAFSGITVSFVVVICLYGVSTRENYYRCIFMLHVFSRFLKPFLVFTSLKRFLRFQHFVCHEQVLRQLILNLFGYSCLVVFDGMGSFLSIASIVLWQVGFYIFYVIFKDEILSSTQISSLRKCTIPVTFQTLSRNLINEVERRKKYQSQHSVTSLSYSVLGVSPVGRIWCLLHTSLSQQSTSGISALASTLFIGVAKSHSQVFPSITDDLTMNSLLTEYSLSLVT